MKKIFNFHDDLEDLQIEILDADEVFDLFLERKLGNKYYLIFLDNGKDILDNGKDIFAHNFTLLEKMPQFDIEWEKGKGGICNELFNLLDLCCEEKGYATLVYNIFGFNTKKEAAEYVNIYSEGKTVVSPIDFTNILEN